VARKTQNYAIFGECGVSVEAGDFCRGVVCSPAFRLPYVSLTTPKGKKSRNQKWVLWKTALLKEKTGLNTSILRHNGTVLLLN
jgi:hypothetical protein